MALQQAVRSYDDLTPPMWDPQRIALRADPQSSMDLGEGIGLANPPRGYASTLDRRRPAAGEIDPRAITGLEDFFQKLLTFWNLTDEQGAALVGYAPQGTSKVARVIGGLATFDTVDERDRVLHLYDIRKLLAGLFRSRELENRWLRTPNPGLDGNTPLNVLLTRTFPNLLKVKQFVEHLAGV